MQKIVLFIEPQKRKWTTPLKIGDLFINRFAIDEDGCNETLKIFNLDTTFWDYKDGELTKNKGQDHTINYY